MITGNYNHSHLISKLAYARYLHGYKIRQICLAIYLITLTDANTS